MKKLLKNFLLTATLVTHSMTCYDLLALDSNIQFSMECGDTQIYSGQTTLCQFIVKAPYDMLEVEVVKFPEFRGFWSENLSLRQGPLALAPEINQRGQLSGLRIAQVGSYLIHSMVGKKDSRIEPMKLLIKRRIPSNLMDSNESSNVYIADGKSIEILDLPPIPPELSHLEFTGAVGILSLSPMDTQIRFQPNEPVNVRFTLTGQGNFAEINHLPITLFKNAELLSRKSYQQGTGDFASKSFDYQLLLHRQTDFEESFGSFLIFNPFSKKYLALNFPKLQFIPLPPEELRKGMDSIELPTHQREFSHQTSFKTRPFFWFIQFLLCLLLGVVHGKRFFDRKRQLFFESSTYRTQLKWEAAQTAGNNQNIEQLAKSASEIAQDFLAEKLNVPRPHALPRRQLLRLASSKLPPEVLRPVQELFAANDELYSPLHMPKLNSQDLMVELRQILKK